MMRRMSAAAGAPVDWPQHWRRCAKMYRFAPVNAADRFASRVRVGHKRARVTMPAKPSYCHAALALHGLNYFKMLDDACFFAAQSMNHQHFCVTTSFTTYITRPVVVAGEGDVPLLTSTGTVTSASKSLILAEAVMLLPDGTEVGRGSGTFMPHPKLKLPKVPTYFDDVAFPLTDEDEVLEHEPHGRAKGGIAGRTPSNWG